MSKNIAPTGSTLAADTVSSLVFSGFNSSFSEDTISDPSSYAIPRGYEADDNSSLSGASTPRNAIYNEDDENSDTNCSYFFDNDNAENTNNNVTREHLRISRSATEVFLRNESAVTSHQGRQNRKGQMSAKFVSGSAAKLQQQNNYSSFKVVEGSRRSRSCTIACDVMSPDCKKPRTMMHAADIDDSDLNLYLGNFTSGSVSLDDFSQNSGSVSSRCVYDDDDDGDEVVAVSNDDDDADDNDSLDVSGGAPGVDYNQFVRKGAMNHLDGFVASEENSKLSAFDSSGANPGIGLEHAKEALRDNESLHVSLTVPQCSMTSDSLNDESSDLVIKDVLASGTTTTTTTTTTTAATFPSISTVTTTPSRSMTSVNNSMDNSIGSDNAGSVSFASLDKGDFREDPRNGRQENPEMLMMFDDESLAQSFQVVEISLDGVTNEKLVKHHNTPAGSPNKQAMSIFINTITTLATPKKDGVDDDGENNDEKDDNGTSFNTNEKEDSVIIPFSPKPPFQVDVVKFDSETASTIYRVNIVEDDISLSRNVSSPPIVTVTVDTCTDLAEDFKSVPTCTTLFVTPEHVSDNDGVSSACVSDRRTPLPQELVNAIQRAVANGDFEDAKSVIVDGTGYLLRCADDTDFSGKTIANEIDEEGLTKLPARLAAEKESGIENLEGGTGSSVSLPVNWTEKIYSERISHEKPTGSSSLSRVFRSRGVPGYTFPRGKECVYQRREHNDIINHSGRKFDVMSESTSVSPCDKSPTLNHTLNIGPHSSSTNSNLEENGDENIDASNEACKKESYETEKKGGEESNFQTMRSTSKLHGNDLNAEELCDCRGNRPGVSKDKQKVNATLCDRKQCVERGNNEERPSCGNTSSPNYYQIDCMDPIVSDEASGDFILGLGEGKKSPFSDQDSNMDSTERAVKIDKNDNKLEMDSSSSLKKWLASSQPGVSSNVSQTGGERSVSNTKTRGQWRAKKKARMLKLDQTFCQKGRPESKTEFLSLLLNMMDDDKVEIQPNTSGRGVGGVAGRGSRGESSGGGGGLNEGRGSLLTSGGEMGGTEGRMSAGGVSGGVGKVSGGGGVTGEGVSGGESGQGGMGVADERLGSFTKKRRDSEQGTADEADVESSEKTLSFPRGIDSIEPNDTHWWSCTKEDLELSYRQARRVRRRLLMKKSRQVRGKRPYPVYSTPEPTASDQSLSPERRSTRDGFVLEESDCCSCCIDVPMSKEMRKYMARMKCPNVGNSERGEGAGYSQDPMMTYAKAAESFVKPDHHHASRYAECECDEDGATWMAEGRTPFSQDGDKFSLLEEYYSRKSEICSFRVFEQGMAASGDQAEDRLIESANFKRNSARISKRKFHAPSVMAAERLKSLSLDEVDHKPKPFNLNSMRVRWKMMQNKQNQQGEEEPEPQTSPDGKFFNSKWRSKTGLNNTGTDAENGERVKEDQSKQSPRDDGRSLYIDLLQSKARIEIDKMKKMDEERIHVRKSVGVTHANRDPNKKKTKMEAGFKVVRFSDVGVKTVKSTENPWNTTVNEMLLRSEKVKGVGTSKDQQVSMSPRYPRSESAKKVSAVPEKTFNFLNELLEQDMQEQKMGYGVGDSRSWKSAGNEHSTKYQANGAASGPDSSSHLPPLSKKPSQIYKDKHRHEGLQTPIISSYRPHEQPQSTRSFDSVRAPVCASSSSSMKSLAAAASRLGRRKGCPHVTGGPKLPVKLVRRTRNLLEAPLMMPPALPQPQGIEATTTPKNNPLCASRSKKASRSLPPTDSFQLSRYSDVFNYYVSPYLRDRAQTSIVQMYQK